MFYNLSDQEMSALLASEVVGHLGCYADGEVYVIPLSYAFEEGNIYGHSFEGMKLDMMRRNNSVCFQVDDMKDLSNWKSVIAWGEFQELAHPEEIKHAMSALSSRNYPIITSETMHLTPSWPFDNGNASAVGGIFFRIKINRITGRGERKKPEIYFAT